MKVGYLKFNPAEPLETQRVDHKIAQRILTIDELERLFITASKNPLTKLVIYFFACTGCRVAEVTNLLWRDFFIGPQKDICVRIQGKGHKDRILKIPDSLWDVIIEYRKYKGLEYEINPHSKSPFLINKYGNNYSTKAIWEVIKQLAVEADIRTDISPHWIRHTFATEVAKDRNSNLWQLQYDMGHASLNTTQIYVHIAQGMEDTSVDHLGYLEILEERLTDIN